VAVEEVVRGDAADQHDQQSRGDRRQPAMSLHSLHLPYEPGSHDVFGLVPGRCAWGGLGIEQLGPEAVDERWLGAVDILRGVEAADRFAQPGIAEHQVGRLPCQARIPESIQFVHQMVRHLVPLFCGARDPSPT
jgi:hypothetical protein